jgi:ABC-type oligopeptide transport system substrate-binding subunit/DNA-binding SARP family transcriptional activator
MASSCPSRPRKSQSLFAYLALHRQRPQPRERLADLFWGDRPERRARRSLTTALWHIRRCLPAEDWLVSDVHAVQFASEADLWLDVTEFEALVARADLSCLQSAVALYRGDFLDGFYDDWVLNERYRLETLFSEALGRLMLGLEAEREYDSALAVGLRLLQYDPLREDAHRLVMRALCRLGQRNAALEQYRRCQEAVQQELSTEPMVETTELYRAILEGHFEIGQPMATTPTVEAAPHSGTGGLPPLPSAYDPLEAMLSCPLVGREREMAFLRDRHQKAQQGQGGLVLISGEAGVGKARLVGEFASQLRWQGACVLWGRCYEFERILPYQPVAEALRAAVPTLPRSELEGQPTWVLVEVTRLVPEILEKLPELDATPTIRSERERMRLFEGLVRFLAYLATQGPLLLVLEDLHWATESTLQLIHYLARHLAAHPVLIVGTLRPEAVGRRHPLETLRQEFGREGLILPLSLGPLSLQAVETLVAEMAGAGRATRPLARRLYQETEGNPFFLMEIVKALFETQRIVLEEGRWRGDLTRISETEIPLPTGVSETVQARVCRLDDDTQQALRLAAVLGREFDFELLDAVWGQGEEATLEALDQLLRHRLIEEGTGVLARDYAFTHHKIQEVIYREMPERQRQRVHGRVALAMEHLYGPQVGDLADELAFHFQEGARHDPALRDRAVDFSLQAGDRARLAYAQQEAISYYEQALELLRKQRAYQRAARTLMKLGLTYHNAFDFGRARRAYDEAFALWQRAGESASAARQQPAPHALRVPIPEPISLDPAVAYDEASLTVINHLYSGLLDLSHELDIVPDVAQSWEVLEGGRWYVFHLRDDVQWSDGARVTAADFEYALKRMLDRATGSFYATLLYDLKGARAFHQGEVASAETVGVQAADDVTLIIELEEPTGHFLSLLARWGIPVPRHVVEVHGRAWASPVHLVTNGPFSLESWEAGQSMALARNPAYHGRFDGNVQRLHLALMPSNAWSERLALYESDQLDAVVISAFPSPELEAARQRHVGDYFSLPRLETSMVGFNASRPPFDDVRVRRALTLAIDRELLADVILGGHVSPATGGLVPPDMPGHSAGIGLPHDPDRARKLLAEAGYPGGRGFPLVNGMLTGPSAASIGGFLEDQWREKLGVESACKAMELDKAVDMVYRDPPLLAGLAWTASYPDPHDFLGVAASHTRSFTRWQSETYDRLVDKARRTTNQRDRMKLYGRADRILIEEVGVMPVVYGRSHLLVKPWIKNHFGSQTTKVFWKDVILEPHEMVGDASGGVQDPGR